MQSIKWMTFGMMITFVAHVGCNKSSRNSQDEIAGEEGVSGVEGRDKIPGIDFPIGGQGGGAGSSAGSSGEGASEAGAQVPLGSNGGRGGDAALDVCVPTGVEQCDGLDNDCDGYEDEDQVCAIVDYSLGNSHVCVLLSNDRVKCWGRDCFGKLGRGEDNNIVCFPGNGAVGDEPGEMNEGLVYVDLRGFVPVDIESGSDHNCVRSAEGRIKCWGSASYGKLGYENTQSKGDDPRTLGRNLPEVDLGLNQSNTPFEVISISLGPEVSCAVLHAPTAEQPDLQRIKCWGKNYPSQLGQGTGCPPCTDDNAVGDQLGEMGDNLVFSNLGTDENDLLLSTTQMMAGNGFSCSAFSNGRAKCIGFSLTQVFGVSNPGRGWSGPGRATGNDVHYVDIETNGEPDFIEDIQVGHDHTCALIRGGRVKCWGSNEHGQLGVGSTDSIEDDFEQIGFIDLGMDMAGEPLVVRQLAVGRYHNCALLEGDGVAGKVKCWGSNAEGELGIGFNANNDGARFSAIGDGPNEMGDELRFVDLGANAIVERIETSGFSFFEGIGYNCALLNSGDLKCWGANAYGQLGRGNVVTIGDDRGEMGDNLLPVPY